jgi:hypothetical protein
MKPALDSQIPKATPTSDMIIKARICHGRLPDIQPPSRNSHRPS